MQQWLKHSMLKANNKLINVGEERTEETKKYTLPFIHLALKCSVGGTGRNEKLTV